MIFGNTLIPIDLYDTDILLVSGGSQRLLDTLHNSLKIEEYEQATKDIDLEKTEVGKTILLQGGQVVMWMPGIGLTSKDKGTLAHEIFHAAELIMQKVGITLCNESSEAFAYLIGYITYKVDEFITSVPSNNNE